MQERYTTKRYQPNAKISPETIEQLKDILVFSPSSINGQPWKFIFIQNEDMKNKLAAVSEHNTHKVENCHTLIVFQVLNSSEKFEKRSEGKLTDTGKTFYHDKIKSKGELEVQNWMKRQAYISLGVLLSACAVMKIDSTAMEGIEQNKYDEILGSTDFTTLFAVPLGERDPEDFNQPQKTPKTRLPKNLIIEEIN